MKTTHYLLLCMSLVGFACDGPPSPPRPDAQVPEPTPREQIEVHVRPEMAEFVKAFRGDPKQLTKALHTYASPLHPELRDPDGDALGGAIAFARNLENTKVTQAQKHDDATCYQVFAEEFPNDPDEHTLHNYQVCWRNQQIVSLNVMVFGQKMGPPPEPAAAVPGEKPLLTLRKSIKTQAALKANQAPPPKPQDGLSLVSYPGPLGDYHAYLSKVPDDGKKHPAIVWIIGGFFWGLSDTPWSPTKADNDQSARQYRDNGIVTMYPALRGVSGNPGNKECFLGEVDDIIAAGEWLKKQPGIDPDRVYIGGHSTGGVLTLLTVQSTDMFRAAIAWGPNPDPVKYRRGCPPEQLPAAELRARAPLHWMDDIKTPTWVVEGGQDNVFIQVLAPRANEVTTVFGVKGRDHFSILRPGNEIVAKQLAQDTGGNVSIEIPREF